MIAPQQFEQNLILLDQVADIQGGIIECGTWRGGMLAAMLEKRPRSFAFGFDSFEGLPPVQEIDGEAAAAWQADTESPIYYDNCSASESEFMDTMFMTGVLNFRAFRGWFKDTIPTFAESHPLLEVAVLRLDGDWYESTKVCLDHLFDLVVPGGLVIIDDYFAWQGCKKAVDEFLLEHPKLKLHVVNQVPYFRK